eukprot:1125922-Prymnesium_polylepis.1
MLARGVPIVYYGTEHAFAQSDNRASLWQTRFSTSDPFYALLRALNTARRSQPSLALARASVVHADRTSLVFSRGASTF